MREVRPPFLPYIPLWRAVSLKTNFSVNLHKRVDEFVSRRRFYFRGDEFAVDRFIFRATIVYQATKHFQGNKSDSEESGWRVDDSLSG